MSSKNVPVADVDLRKQIDWHCQVEEAQCAGSLSMIEVFTDEPSCGEVVVAYCNACKVTVLIPDNAPPMRCKKCGGPNNMPTGCAHGYCKKCALDCNTCPNLNVAKPIDDVVNGPAAAPFAIAAPAAKPPPVIACHGCVNGPFVDCGNKLAHCKHWVYACKKCTPDRPCAQVEAVLPSPPAEKPADGPDLFHFPCGCARELAHVDCRGHFRCIIHGSCPACDDPLLWHRGYKTSGDLIEHVSTLKLAAPTAPNPPAVEHVKRDESSKLPPCGFCIDGPHVKCDGKESHCKHLMRFCRACTPEKPRAQSKVDPRSFDIPEPDLLLVLPCGCANIRPHVDCLGSLRCINCFKTCFGCGNSLAGHRRIATSRELVENMAVFSNYANSIPVKCPDCHFVYPPDTFKKCPGCYADSNRAVADPPRFDFVALILITCRECDTLYAPADHRVCPTCDTFERVSCIPPKLALKKFHELNHKYDELDKTITAYSRGKNNVESKIKKLGPFPGVCYAIQIHNFPRIAYTLDESLAKKLSEYCHQKYPTNRVETTRLECDDIGSHFLAYKDRYVLSYETGKFDKVIKLCGTIN